VYFENELAIFCNRHSTVQYLHLSAGNNTKDTECCNFVRTTVHVQRRKIIRRFLFIEQCTCLYNTVTIGSIFDNCQELYVSDLEDRRNSEPRVPCEGGKVHCQKTFFFSILVQVAART
jgi:hypothetical protein